uniref:Uncharacterized protein n=1 Tax=Culex tarsalis TaxID=7177 RepID=A0A1Q3EWI1_CULTA
MVSEAYSENEDKKIPLFITVSHPVSIDNQNSLAKATWHVWSATYQRELPIGEDAFVRMWKTLILRHLQDVFERYSSCTADHLVPIHGTMPVPTPLADLLNALGMYEDPSTGMRHRVAAPSPPAELSPDSWWKLDGQIVRDWVLANTAIQQCSLGLVQQHEFGLMGAKFVKRPLMLTAREGDDETGNVTIRAKAAGPRPEDALVRANNDELFENPYPVKECGIVMSTVNAPCNRASSMRRV